MRTPFSPDAAVTAAPINLPDITDEMVERATKTYIGGASGYADTCMRTVLTEFRDALLAATPQWQPIERDQIRAGMRIRATIASSGCISTRVGVAHHTSQTGEWCTEGNWLLTGWANQITCEVDPSTIPDPDAELIEALAGLLDLTDPEDAREVIATVRAHDEAVTGDE